MVEGRSVWYDPVVAAINDKKRQLTPVHYYLMKNDFLAAAAELRRGADPSVEDEYGRNVLELVSEMLAGQLQTALSTSIPIDYLEDTLAKLSKFPFPTPYIEDYAEFHEGMDNQLNLFRYFNYSPHMTSSASVKYDLPLTNVHTRENEADNEYSKLTRRDGSSREKTEGGKSPPSAAFPLPFQDKQIDYIPETPQAIQQDVLLVIEHTIMRPLPAKIVSRMNHITKRITSLLNLATNLAVCQDLVDLSNESLKNSMALITFPFLYIAMMRKAFITHPIQGCNMQRYNPLNPANGRRLVNVIIKKSLPGAEILNFLKQNLRSFTKFISLCGIQNFYPTPEVSQFLLHMAFVLDSPKLFNTLLTVQPQIFDIGDIFDWDLLIYELMPHPMFESFFKRLMHLRMKRRIDRRLSTDTHYPPGQHDLKVPFEERLITKDVIDQFKQTYTDRGETKELEKMLKHWKYGAAREIPRAPESRNLY